MSETEQTADPAHRWLNASRTLLFVMGMTFLIAIFQFGYGLTVSEGSAAVVLDSDVLNPASMPEGVLKGVEASATFEYSNITDLADRARIYLGDVAMWLSIAFTAFVLSRFARHLADGEPLVGPMRRRDWDAAAGVAVAWAVVVPLGVWAQGTAVIAAAGEPSGIDPVLAIGWPWVVVAIVFNVMARLDRLPGAAPESDEPA
ncbi:hypothetical protein [Demequina flava]|uniref:hypothetical protein n=1 Tax=Demequina flava TaxID=1095025 RepID=UPI0007837068|nr:hypothetical protein [Demequina flava]